ncbi:hypothetical protein SAMN05518848_102597 [Paenibacillus sp. PDC88]|nr:hypothetical protein SAMN05518848_102597 [Paenibacillus sp. PDC88]
MIVAVFFRTIDKCLIRAASTAKRPGNRVSRSFSLYDIKTDMKLMLRFQSLYSAKAINQRFQRLELILPSRRQANPRPRVNGLQDDKA